MLRDRGKTMFDATDLSALDPKYFSIIFTDAFDVEYSAVAEPPNLLE